MDNNSSLSPRSVDGPSNGHAKPLAIPDEFGFVTKGLADRSRYLGRARPLPKPDPLVDAKELARLRNENTALRAAVSGLEARVELLQVQVETASVYANRKLTIACGFPEKAADRIAQCVAKHFGVEVANLREAGRLQRFVRPRQACYRLFIELLNLSMPNVGRYFRRDHTTIMHGIHSTHRLMESDVDWRMKYDAARAELLAEQAP